MPFHHYCWNNRTKLLSRLFIMTAAMKIFFLLCLSPVCIFFNESNYFVPFHSHFEWCSQMLLSFPNQKDFQKSEHICTLLLTHNPLYSEWDLRESTSVQANGRVIITAETTKCPTEPQRGRRGKKKTIWINLLNENLYSSAAQCR